MPAHRWRTRLACLLLLCAALSLAARPRPHALKRRNPSYAPLSDASLAQLVALSDLDDALDWHDTGSLLAKILVPRTPGSANLTRVQGVVEGHFKKLGWVRLPPRSLAALFSVRA